MKIPSFMYDVGFIPKEDVDYGEGGDGRFCHNCLYFLNLFDPGPGETTERVVHYPSGCELVEGAIHPNSMCQMWVPSPVK